MSANDSFVYVIVGAPGSGKSSQVRLILADQAPRCMVFDPMREFAGDGSFQTSLIDLARRKLIHAGAGPVRIVYQPDTNDPAKLKQRFDAWCKLAFAARDLLAVVDEAADVTSPNRYEVPEGWSTLLRQGRHAGVRIVAATQRPADIDKRLWTFATRIRTGRLNYGTDQRDLANVLNVDLDEVAGLLDRQWIERDMLTGQVARGSMEWIKGRPVNVARNQAKAADPAKPDRVGRATAHNAPPGRPEARAVSRSASKRKKVSRKR